MAAKAQVTFTWSRQRLSPGLAPRSRAASLPHFGGSSSRRSDWTSSAGGRLAARAAGGSGGSGGADNDNRLLNAALKDPVSFLGGVFAGFLALDLQQEPLRSWVQQTSTEAGLKYQAAVERVEAERRARAAAQGPSSPP